ncbi:MAG: InlB B-repeat-containing protein [Corallococcus sp.]|nr:InlB B-repeat-containing protein [Corallococcus sp.]MCM1360091.1 InlB B-repeat-containing protein [Corallococcus sp.]MCM1395648.1 InlB B-repeat-containing protein [Corallococcus sp.]
MKKITAIVLCVLLAMSALVVLAACGTTEYVVSFRESNSKIIYQGKTINGKAVEPKAPAKEGYDFKGWYKNVSTDADNNLVFDDVMDFDKALDGDLDLYAKYEVSEKPAASSNPYYVVGSFAGDSWNGNGCADSNRLLIPDAEGIPTAKFTVLPTTEFKIKYAAVGWHDDLDVAYGALKGVTLAAGVELTGIDGVTDANGLFTSANATEPAKGNIKLSDATIAANKQLQISLTYVESSKSINIKVLAITDAPVVDDSCPSGYRLAGQFGSDDAWNTNDGKYKLTKDATDGNLHKITITLVAGSSFKVKENLFKVDGSANWDGKSFGYDKVTVTKADDVTLPTGVTTDQLFTDGGGGNIQAAKDCTVTLTLDYAAGTITIHVTEITE